MPSLHILIMGMQEALIFPAVPSIPWAWCLQRLQQIVDSVPELGSGSRVMDVGSGTGCLIPHLQQRGVHDILAVDLAPDMLAKVGWDAAEHALPILALNDLVSPALCRLRMKSTLKRQCKHVGYTKLQPEEGYVLLTGEGAAWQRRDHIRQPASGAHLDRRCGERAGLPGTLRRRLLQRCLWERLRPA